MRSQAWLGAGGVVDLGAALVEEGVIGLRSEHFRELPAARIAASSASTAAGVHQSSLLAK
jgi:hypothetical protein